MGRYGLSSCKSEAFPINTSIGSFECSKTSTAFQPLYGRFSDIFGRKLMLLTSLAIFTVFSLACAVSQTLIQLIVFRALAGIGGAGIATLALIMYVLGSYLSV